MKGLKVVKALPSNILEIQPLLKEAQEEGVLFDSPSEKQLVDFKVMQVIPQLNASVNYVTGKDKILPPYSAMWYLAQRGKGFWGLMQVYLATSHWDGKLDTFMVNLLYIKKERRKLGIGKMFIEQLKKDAENMGVSKIEFFTTTEDMEKLSDKYGAKKVREHGRIEL